MEQDKILTGFRDIDNATGGFINSDLICVAARPCMGKTTFALNIAVNVAKNNIPILVVSLDMNKNSIINRIINIETATSTDYSDTIKNISLFKQNIYISDNTLSIDEVENICQKSKAENDIGLVIIDYLHLIKSDNEPTEEIIRRLKAIAKELNVPVIVLSQLPKDLEKRKNCRPVLSDFKNSSCIVDYADTIFFIYKDDYYNRNSEKKDIIEIIIAKNKNRDTGIIELADIRSKYVDLVRGDD